MPLPWESLLQGEEAHTARQCIDRLLAEATAVHSVAEPSLAKGSLGLVLAHVEAARAFASEAALDRAEGLLAEVLEQSASKAQSSTLMFGAPGLALALAWFLRVRGVAPDENPLWDLPLQVRSGLAHSQTAELTMGLSGLAVSLREASVDGNPHAAASARVLLDSLERLAERGTFGARWRARPEAQAVPGYSLGVAHGVPGVLGALALLARVDGLQSDASTLFDQTFAWLAARRRASAELGLFPNSVGLDERDTGDFARLAWCFGDAGIAGVWSMAGASLGRPQLVQRAADLLFESAQRPRPTWGLQDISVCHGLAGTLHIFNRVGQTAGHAGLRALARAEVLTLLRHLDLSRGPDAWKLQTAAEPALVEGMVGVALVLIAAVSSVNPWWDRLLLLSAPD